MGHGLGGAAAMQVAVLKNGTHTVLSYADFILAI